MRAEDTVMNEEETWEIYKANGGRGIPPREQVNSVAEAQAEISFKVGKTLGVAETMKLSLKAMEDMKKAGRREVVEWIEENAPHYGCDECGFEQHLDDDWQAQVKGVGN